MSEIKALETLRTAARNMAKGRNLENHEECNLLLLIADEIEAEIAERFVELPVDADGVPIRVGDELECHANGYDGTFTVFAIGNDVVVGNHDIEWIRRNPSKWFHTASFCTYVKPRTLEDVLESFIVDYDTWDVDCKVDRLGERRLLFAKYADEIRELLGVGE